MTDEAWAEILDAIARSGAVVKTAWLTFGDETDRVAQGLWGGGSGE